MTSIDRFNGLDSAVAIKRPCRVATTANITLSGTQTIDGVAVVADDRVLVKNQTDQTTNGIYVVSATAWTRDKDFDGPRDVVKGTMVNINSGTASAGVIYQLTTADPVTIGTSNLTFSALAVSQATAILTALGAMDSTTGVVTQTGASSFTKRTLTGTSNQVTVTNGDGVSGNPTFSLPQSINTSASVQFTNIALNNSGSLRTTANAGDTLKFNAYDVDGAAYTTFATLTANNTPTFDLADTVTKASGYIYRAGGTDVPITDGGTGASTAANAQTNLSLKDGTASLKFSDLILGLATDPSTFPTPLSIGPITLTGSNSLPSNYYLASITLPNLSDNTGATSVYGFNVDGLQLDDNASVTTSYGFRRGPDTIVSGTTSLVSSYGVHVYLPNISGSFSSVTSAYGFVANMPTTGNTTSIGSAYGFFVNSPSVNAGSSITNMVGLNINNMGSTGVTNGYGVKISAQSGATNNYPYYYASGSFYVDANGFMKDGGRSRVSSQFDKTTNTTLANVTGLTATVIAAGVYAFRAHLTTTAGSGGGMKVAISGTATATTVNYTAWNYNGTTINAVSSATALASAVGAATAITTNVIIEGSIVVANAGTLTVQMAQNASDGTASSVLVGSTFTVERIS